MKNIHVSQIIYCITLSLILVCCSDFEDTRNYFQLVNEAELAICDKQFDEAMSLYAIAFEKIEKPFGKDVFNAALVSGIQANDKRFKAHLAMLIDNMDDHRHIKQIFVYELGYISEEAFQNLVDKQNISYNLTLREEMAFLLERDQLFRPMYDTHMDTIEQLRKLNLNRIIELANAKGFPSQIELGYSDFLRDHDHYIVLHHTAQMRSGDKNIYDMEPLLRNAVDNFRMDPERAMWYLAMQNDQDKKGYQRFEIFSFKHDLLPEEISKKQYIPRYNAQKISDINTTRSEWNACSTDDIIKKALFLSSSELPFKFPSVQFAVNKLAPEMSEEEVMEQVIAFEYLYEPL